MLRDVSVREVMNGDYVGISESDPLTDSVELLLSEGVDVGIVLRGDETVGALTATDALATFVDVENAGTADVAAAMTDDVPTIRPDRGLHEARDRMTSLDSTWLLVTEGDRPLGVVTEHDLLAGSTIGTEPAPDAEREAETAVMTSARSAAASKRPA